MPDSITLTLPYPPSSNSMKAIFTPTGGKARARMITTKAGREYYDRVAENVLLAGSPSLGDAPVHMDIQVYRPDNRKRDLSNTRKAVEDGLVKAGVIDDDDQIVTDPGDKRHIDRANPRVVVTLTPIAGAERQTSLAEAVNAAGSPCAATGSGGDTGTATATGGQEGGNAGDSGHDMRAARDAAYADLDESTKKHS